MPEADIIYISLFLGRDGHYFPPLTEDQELPFPPPPIGVYSQIDYLFVAQNLQLFKCYLSSVGCLGTDNIVRSTRDEE